MKHSPLLFSRLLFRSLQQSPLQFSALRFYSLRYNPLRYIANSINAWRDSAAIGLLLSMLSAHVNAADFDYQLTASEVKPDVYVVGGVAGDLTFKNGGNILNTGFIVAEQGVIVIDVGPSRLYGEQLRALIARTTDKPVIQVYITHQHPDHFFGLQAFEGVDTAALPGTISDLKLLAGDYSDNMYRLIGNAMLGTEIVLPKSEVLPGVVEVGGRSIELLALGGHTASDLAAFDKASGVLFAGDLVFHQRAPTTPSADIPLWLESLAKLKSVPYSVLVPGHGPVSENATPIDETADYVDWLLTTLQSLAEQGMSMAEALQQKIADRFTSLVVVQNEYERSVVHLYGNIEEGLLPPIE